MRFEEQACQVLAFSISEEVEKRPFAPLIIDSSQIFFNEFPETNLVLFTYYQCDLLMESLMQTFSDAKLLGCPLQRSLLKPVIHLG